MLIRELLIELLRGTFMKNKYIFFKKLFNKHVIVFVNKNGNYVSVGEDRYLLKYIKKKRVSYVLIDNEFNVKVVDVDNNKYEEYLIKEYFLRVLKKKKMSI